MGNSMTELSPAAQAVWDAWQKAPMSLDIEQMDRDALAAALRAAVDQVVPEEPLYGGDQRWMYERDARHICRRKLLAIATELEGS